MNKNKWFLKGGRGSGRTFRLLCETYENKIAELEAENAELKHTIAELRRDKDNLNTHTKAQEKLSEYRSDQLTKAKELLERLLITSCNSDVLNLLPNCSEVLRVRVEAEQFISEVENDSRTVS